MPSPGLHLAHRPHVLPDMCDSSIPAPGSLSAPAELARPALAALDGPGSGYTSCSLSLVWAVRFIRKTMPAVISPSPTTPHSRPATSHEVAELIPEAVGAGAELELTWPLRRKSVVSPPVTTAAPEGPTCVICPAMGSRLSLPMDRGGGDRRRGGGRGDGGGPGGKTAAGRAASCIPKRKVPQAAPV